MNGITHVIGTAAHLIRDNVDTDTISPGQRRSQVGKPRKLLYTPEELAGLLFSAWRYDEADNENPEFILNKEPYRNARFLLTGKNFGCGSSRETAAEMFLHFGIRCIIAESFGEIFYGNCIKNGVVPVVLPHSTIARMVDVVAKSAGAAPFKLDLGTRTITFGPTETVEFDIPDLRRRQLMEGLDEIEMTLSWADEINAYQAERRNNRHWIFPQAG